MYKIRNEMLSFIKNVIQIESNSLKWKGNTFRLDDHPSPKQSLPRFDSLVGLWGALSVLAYSALDEVSLLSGLRGRDRELPLLGKRLADPQSRRECRLSRRPGIDRHLANRTLSLGLPANTNSYIFSESSFTYIYM